MHKHWTIIALSFILLLSFILFSKRFILVEVTVTLELILGTLGWNTHWIRCYFFTGHDIHTHAFTHSIDGPLTVCMYEET